MTEIALDALRRSNGERVIFDCRGSEPDEYLMEQGYRDGDALPPAIQHGYLQRRARQRRVSEEADAVVCVSHSMAAYLVDDSGISPEKVTISPCCVDTDLFRAGIQERERTRRELDVQDRFVVVYCGSLQRWQCPEQSVRVFRRIQRFHPAAFFLGLTTQPQAMRGILDAAGIGRGDFGVITVPHVQVPKYLSAGDAGLLLRESSMVNRVASPVKFAEYLASGIPVIISEGVGDYSELVQREGVGLVLAADLEAPTVDASLRSWLEANCRESGDVRARCRAIAESRLSTANHAEQLLGLYQKLSRTRAQPAS